MIWLFGFFIGCLEKVTGEEIPLDPRFYAAVEAIRGAEAQGGGASVPFSSEQGEKIRIQGIIESEDQMSVDIDIRVPDPKAPGGMSGKGKILLERPGPFELSVPKNLGSLELQAFQDLDSDGPNASDPFAQLNIEIATEDIENVVLKLVVGARGAAPVHQEVQPEEGSKPKQGIPDNPDPFGGVGGERIALKGILKAPPEQRIDLDIFTPDDTSPGGRKMLGKMKLFAGEYVIMVPQNYGSIILEAFVDFEQDGPGIGDLMGIYPANPIVILDQEIQNIDIELMPSSDGKMPQATANQPKMEE